VGGLVAGLGAFLGHVLPVWLKFRGGKGVATFLGVLFGLAWPLAFMFVAVWIGLALVVRMSSVSSLIGAWAMPVGAYAIGQPGLVAGLAAMAAVILITHRSNIVRIFKGEESTISRVGKG